MPTVLIIIDHQPGGLVMNVSGDVEPGGDSLPERLARAAVAAMDEEMQKLEQSGQFGGPIVTGDKRAIDRSPYANPRHTTDDNYWMLGGE